MSLKIHYLVPAADGPLQSREVAKTPAGPIGTNLRYRAACGATVDGYEHRATGPDTPWAVRCAQCKATEEFRAGAAKHGTERPKERELRVAPEDMA